MFPLRQSTLTDTKIRVGRLFRDSVNPEAVIVLRKYYKLKPTEMFDRCVFGSRVEKADLIPCAITFMSMYV